MIVAVHAVQQENGTYQARLVLTRNRADHDPDIGGILEAVTTAVWSLGYPSRADSHTLLAWGVPRRALRLVTREMVRVSIQTVAQYREAAIPLPDDIALPFTRSV